MSKAALECTHMRPHIQEVNIHSHVQYMAYLCMLDHLLLNFSWIFEMFMGFHGWKQGNVPAGMLQYFLS